jgi:hypothetical protein
VVVLIVWPRLLGWPGGEMASAGSQSSVGGTASNSIDVDGPETQGSGGTVNAKYPLWAHASKLSIDGTGRGGNTRFKFHFCDKDFPGSYSRVRAHLLKTTGSGVKICSKVPYSVHEQLCKEDREANAAIVNSAPKNQLVKLPPYENSSSAPSTKKRKAKQTNIADSFTAEERHIADSHIARMFFTGGLHIFTLYLCCTVLFLCTSQNINFISFELQNLGID